MGVAQLTEVAGVHHTVVRDHLTRLVDAGLITFDKATSDGRGRPRLLYSTAPGPRRRDSQVEHYRRLALLLAEALRNDIAPREAGRRAGVEAALDAAHRGDAASVDALTVLIGESDRMGFEPSLDTVDDSHVDIVLSHCPFGDVAAEDPETICSLHAGIAGGIAEATEELSLVGMTVVDPLSAGCKLHLELPGTSVPDPKRRRSESD